jgi:hypothetical protein
MCGVSSINLQKIFFLRSIDRLGHRSHILTTKGPSYRTRKHTKLRCGKVILVSELCAGVRQANVATALAQKQVAAR